MTETAVTHSTPLTEPAALTRRVVETCDAAGAFMDYWGFKATYGRIWTLLALRREPMSQSDIAETLQVSRSLVSGSIAELARYKLVRPVGEGRHAPYEAVMDVWPTIAEVLRSREWMLVESVRLALDAAIHEAELADAEGLSHPYDLEKMRQLQSMSEIAQAFLRLLMRMRMPRPANGLSQWARRASSFLRRLSTFA